MQTLSGLWAVLRDGTQAYFDENMVSRGAAIAFYIVTAFAPVVYVAILIASAVFGHEAAAHAVTAYLRHIMSQQSARILRLAIDQTAQGGNLLGSIFGFVFLLITITGVFGEMEDSLNVIWRAPNRRPLIERLIRGRISSLLLVIVLGFALLLSMTWSALTDVLGQRLAAYASIEQATITVLNFGVSFLLLSLLFAAIYKTLPNRDLEWRDVYIGALGTALLFQFGQGLLNWYLAEGGVGTRYGVAGGIIALLIWSYYSAQVFLLGAEFAKAYARRFRNRELPQHEKTLAARA
jgi:membrane protein